MDERAYEMSGSVCEWPEITDEIRSLAFLPTEFLSDVLERLERFQSRFHKLCAERKSGVFEDEILGNGLVVVVPLMANRYLAFSAVVSVNDGDGVTVRNIIYVMMIDVHSVTADGTGVTGAFASRDYDPSKGIEISGDLARLVGWLGSVTTPFSADGH